MAAEYVLVPKKKYEQYEKDTLSSSESTPPSTTELSQPPKDSTNTPAPTASFSEQPDGVDAAKSSDGDSGKKEQTDGKGGNLFMAADIGADLSDSSDGEHLSPDDYDVDDVQSSFSASELKYVQPILTAMQEDDKVMSWNKQTGEIELQGRSIPDSNVIELLKDTLTASLHPAGKMEFYRGLDMLKIKLKCIKNSKNKALLTLMREDKIMPRKKTTKPVKRLKSNKAVNGWISWS